MLSVRDSIEAISKVDSLQAYFQGAGYLESSLLVQIEKDTLGFRISLGPHYRWSEIELDSIPEDIIRVLGKPNLEYSGPFLWMEKLVGISENQGYPFAKASLDSVRIRDHKLSGRVVYDSGPLILWDSLNLLPGSKTKQTYLQLWSGLVPGEPFSQEKFAKSSQRIKRSPYFTLSSESIVTFQYQKARPVYSITDRRLNVFDGVIGLIPNENLSGRLLVTGKVDLQLYHLGGKGRDFSLEWQRINIGSQSLEIGLKESFVFRSLLDVEGRFSLLKQDSSFVNRVLELDFGYRISDFGYLKFFTKRQAGDLVNPGEASGFPNFPESIDYRWNHYGLKWNWTKLDDVVYPRRGIDFNWGFSVGNKRIIQNTSVPEQFYEALEMNSLQIQSSLDLGKHLFISPSWGMWFRGAGGFIHNDQLFLNEYFRLGGLKSIRGFNEKYLFAKAYSHFSVEQRFFFATSSYLLAFSDFGILDNPYFSPRKDSPVSFGAGINLDTDGGLFSFVFALGKSNVQPISFEYTRIHFGYLARF
jgi:outer membrane protein assembly factor BamA